MNKSFVLSATLLLAPLAANAGNFFGPAPFRNGSPLASGTDGVYQAVATAPNLTGLFSWTISGGVQTAGQQNNRWVFFVDGQLLSGTTVANISDSKVAGVLDSGIGTGIPTTGNGTFEPPLAFVVSGSGASGQFQGDINLNSPVAAFDGKGNIQGTQTRVDQIVYILDVPTDLFLSNSNFDPVFVEPVVIPGSILSLQNKEFNFRGTRLSTNVTQANQQAQVPGAQN